MSSPLAAPVLDPGPVRSHLDITRVMRTAILHTDAEPGGEREVAAAWSTPADRVRRVPPPWATATSPARVHQSSSDGELLSLITSGSGPALTLLLDRHRRCATAVAARICGHELAEEAVQEAFAQIALASDRYRHELGSVRSWILGIVHHRAIDAVRRNARHTSRRADAAMLDGMPSEDHVEATAERRDEARGLRALVQLLPDEQAQIIHMAYFDDLSHAEIAGLTGLPLGTVKSRIRLALTRLRTPANHEMTPATDTPNGIRTRDFLRERQAS